ncbi:sugar transferase [Sporolactobacillus terrae]|uniref:sugar transferase n=1 Tax=Sporolactobacillus terrae TaxID=269673 RepID=UPI00048E8F2D|nr:sugar transferase [Sporolactobacillus terrae]
MKKYILTITETEKEHAGSKAKNDCSFFLHSLGYLSIYLDKDMGRLEKYLFANETLNRKLSVLDAGDLLLIQYPTYIGKMYMKILLNKLKKRNVRTVLLIHDVETLREHFYDEKLIKEEIDSLNKFNIIISHNDKMTEWLRRYGITSEIIELEIFDYQTSNRIDRSITQENQIVFAGNLNKSLFLTRMSTRKTRLNLYGPNPQKKVLNDRIRYIGSFSPDELPVYLTGKYGLVWDGDTLSSCKGKYGNYLRFNNPHKASLYISSEMPVIIWKEAAIADFIVNNHLGLAIDSLADVDRVMESVSDDEYKEFMVAVKSMSEKLRSGYFVKKAMKKAENILMEGQ